MYYIGERGGNRRGWYWWNKYRRLEFYRVQGMTAIFGGLSTTSLLEMRMMTSQCKRVISSLSCGEGVVESETNLRRQRIPNLSRDWKCIGHMDRLNIQRKSFFIMN